MFRTRLAALVVAGSLSFTSGCMGFGFGNMFGCNHGCGPGGACCGSAMPAGPCCGDFGAYSSPAVDYGSPPLMPQHGVPGDAPPGVIMPNPTPRMQTVPVPQTMPMPQSVPVPAAPSSVRR
jgi:hypothetical protein